MVGSSSDFSGTTRILQKFSWGRWVAGAGGAIGTVAVMIKQELLLPFIGGIFVIEAVSVILQVGSTSCARNAFLRWPPCITTLSSGLVGIEDHCALLDASLIFALFALTTLKCGDVLPQRHGDTEINKP